MLMACSNDYLGLSMDARVKDAARAALYNFSTSCTGSRLLNGTLTPHEELERELADFLHKEKCLTFSTGFLGCLSVISALTGRQDILYFDRENHASLYDGARLTYGTLRKYRHDDIDHLAKLLAQDADKPGGRFVVTDGVFSMSGHIANLPEIIKVARQYGARVLVDDAHSTGVLGANGRGTAEHFDLHDEVDLIVGTFSKAFASVGGFVAGDTDIVNYIKYVARPFIFTAALPAMQIAATRKALEIIATEPEHRYRLWKTIDTFRSGLNQLGFNTLGSKGPIVPIFVGDEQTTLQFWKTVWNEGIFALPALTPSVPPGESIIRMAINANHTVEDVRQLLQVYARVGRQLGVIS
jgi:8-amino-7-oxononanoate synthase